MNKLKINFVIIIGLISCWNISGQITDTLNFKVTENSLIWNKVYNQENDKLLTYFKKTVISNLKTDNLQEVENRLSFEIREDNVNTKKYGGTWGNTLIPLKYPLHYLVLIDFKENKYRVTVKSIKANYGMQLGFVEFSDVVVRKEQIKNKKIIIRGLGFLNQHFSEKFTITEKKDDW
ncbi:hypothetical protein LPB03_13580 [Polaribacter vadi]|uniref:DUF4468 domain-containing protein n=1 Tax=Polaribacter vadi TaxID=1774273 RepID=A0A1B8U2H4_9FLAO|nr:hypothetical protein [Polaribacter vadi]AOW18422.1 hypothetical protein LPB03_13580 [Polaribacter vadi]OBY66083.1 hypothetical protein LPB3_02030 [Polaribacter vadi]